MENYFGYFSTKIYVLDIEMDLLNEAVLLKTKSTLFNFLIRETSQFLCYGRLLNMTYIAYKNAFFREMQFCSHCYTVVSYQALFRLSVCKIPAVKFSGAKMCVFARSATLVPRLYSFVGFCNYSMFCYALRYVHSGFAIIFIGEDSAGCFA